MVEEDDEALKLLKQLMAIRDGEVTGESEPETRRSELRKADVPALLQALESKESMKLETVIRQAEREGIDLLGGLGTFPQSTGIAASFPGTLAPGSGQFILNYRAMDHTPDFLKSLVKKIETQPREVDFVVFKDPATSEWEWQAVKQRLEADAVRMKAAGRKVVFVDNVRFSDLEMLVKYRASLAGTAMNGVMQFVDPAAVTSKGRIYINRALLGAVPLANGRIVVVGSKDPISQARRFATEKIIMRTFAAMRSLARSA